MNNIYLTGSIRKDWLHVIDEYWGERDTPYFGYFYLFPEWLS